VREEEEEEGIRKRENFPCCVVRVFVRSIVLFRTEKLLLMLLSEQRLEKEEDEEKAKEEEERREMRETLPIKEDPLMI